MEQITFNKLKQNVMTKYQSFEIWDEELRNLIAILTIKGLVNSTIHPLQGSCVWYNIQDQIKEMITTAINDWDIREVYGFIEDFNSKIPQRWIKDKNFLSSSNEKEEYILIKI